MFLPVKVKDIELSGGVRGVEGLEGYASLRGLVRLHGTPLGVVTVPVKGGRCSGADLSRAIIGGLGRRAIEQALALALEAPVPREGIDLAGSLATPPAERSGPLPSLTVAVCTRDRPEDLGRCIESLLGLDYPDAEYLVIDNAPARDDAERLVGDRYPWVRYVREPRPGLNWARNRAIVEAHGEVIAYADDDVVVDRSWARALGRAFADDPSVAAVTGLVVPWEIETEAQLLFEKNGGFGRGFTRARYLREPGMKPFHLGAGSFGTGANMAYRRRTFEAIGGFDPALDVGTPTAGGGDLEMFFRVLQEGHALLYEPRAIVRHRHRRDRAGLRAQMAGNGSGFHAYLLRSALAYPRDAWAMARFDLWWLWKWFARRLWIGLTRPVRLPRELILAELRGSAEACARYARARRQADRTRRACRDREAAREHAKLLPGPASRKAARGRGRGRSSGSRPSGLLKRLAGLVARARPPIERRTVDISRPLQPLTGISSGRRLEVVVALGDRVLGVVPLANHGGFVGRGRLADAIAGGLVTRLLDPSGGAGAGTALGCALARVAERCALRDTGPETLPASIPVSIVVPTRDRPEDLRACLRSLAEQATPRRVEIIVVDNNPDSGATARVVSEFPRATRVCERRRGLSYARNRGFTASTCEIVATVDDDVVAPPGWLEALIAPFARSDVMGVTGNVLPFRLETKAEQLFEAYGGLGRGFEARTFDAEWFDGYSSYAVETWRIGATANAAFRAAIFADPSIGLLDEALDAGMPTGCSGDTDLFYRILRAGYAMAYEPGAVVWHKHRSTMRAFCRQIYNYSKGHVAYHLTTVVRDGDLRAIPWLLVGLPLVHLRRIAARLRRRSIYPVWLILIEIVGNMVGPAALWRARRIVRRRGRSDPYVRPDRRPAPSAEAPSGDPASCGAPPAPLVSYGRAEPI